MNENNSLGVTLPQCLDSCQAVSCLFPFFFTRLLLHTLPFASSCLSFSLSLCACVFRSTNDGRPRHYCRNLGLGGLGLALTSDVMRLHCSPMKSLRPSAPGHATEPDTSLVLWPVNMGTRPLEGARELCRRTKPSPPRIADRFFFYHLFNRGWNPHVQSSPWFVRIQMVSWYIRVTC